MGGACSDPIQAINQKVITRDAVPASGRLISSYGIATSSQNIGGYNQVRTAEYSVSGNQYGGMGGAAAGAFGAATGYAATGYAATSGMGGPAGGYRTERMEVVKEGNYGPVGVSAYETASYGQKSPVQMSRVEMVTQNGPGQSYMLKEKMSESVYNQGTVNKFSETIQSSIPAASAMGGEYGVMEKKAEMVYPGGMAASKEVMYQSSAMSAAPIAERMAEKVQYSNLNLPVQPDIPYQPMGASMQGEVYKDMQVQQYGGQSGYKSVEMDMRNPITGATEVYKEVDRYGGASQYQPQMKETITKVSNVYTPPPSTLVKEVKTISPILIPPGELDIFGNPMRRMY